MIIWMVCGVKVWGVSRWSLDSKLRIKLSKLPMDLSDKIIKIIREKEIISTLELIRTIGGSESSIFRQLKKLQLAGRIIKIGQRPHVSYRLSQQEALTPTQGVQHQSQEGQITTLVYKDRAGQSLKTAHIPTESGKNRDGQVTQEATTNVPIPPLRNIKLGYAA